MKFDNRLSWPPSILPDSAHHTMSYYVQSTPRHRSHSLSAYPSPMPTYSTSPYGHNTTGQYYHPPTPGGYAAYGGGTPQRYNSVGGSYRGASYAVPSTTHHIPTSHTRSAHGPAYYVAPSTHHHSTHRGRHHSHRRSQSTSSHRRHATPVYADSGRHHNYHHSSSKHYRPHISLADRIRNFFGIGHHSNHRSHSRTRFTDARTGREVDTRGRPIIAY
ncbi:hypothetical protein HETIRDRAFT_151046 [Heterobasidion irregulare TC 32-1]|uniref:Uncharacterized protein n=1 Tax=Heterobasidion irregulare (strain TC 32-1) TaxID=747525 RepID=W4KF74_HETIT|nr:uncharacterized protein HETIRDRAFT_151046 [Heterobasidion irregulare TC 32-1]ETW84369.1 hypothetical protein HETIRDRAFT_151046 [Heterobasidion irregulare TC 32-1]